MSLHAYKKKSRPALWLGLPNAKAAQLTGPMIATAAKKSFTINISKMLTTNHQPLKLPTRKQAAAAAKRQADLAKHMLGEGFTEEQVAIVVYGAYGTATGNLSPLDGFKKPRRIRSRTTQRAREESQYRRRVKVWLTLPENRWCAVAKALGKEKCRATQAHHVRGRIGKLLLMEAHWKPVSAAGHLWIENNRTEARKLGLLAPYGQYNTVPKE